MDVLGPPLFVHPGFVNLARVSFARSYALRRLSMDIDPRAFRPFVGADVARAALIARVITLHDGLAGSPSLADGNSCAVTRATERLGATTAPNLHKIGWTKARKN